MLRSGSCTEKVQKSLECREDASECYWNVLENAIKGQVRTVPHQALNEVFLVENIYVVIGTLYPKGGHSQEDVMEKKLPDDIVKFAYGS